MSKFKVGDRAKFVGMDGVAYRGVVSEVRPAEGDIVIDVDPGQRYSSDRVARFEHEADPIPRAERGPRPLTLTGGKARFTVRSGWTTNPGPAIYRLGKYNR